MNIFHIHIFSEIDLSVINDQSGTGKRTLVDDFENTDKVYTCPSWYPNRRFL